MSRAMLRSVQLVALGAVVAGVLALVVATALLWLAASERGTAWLAGMLERRAGPALRIASIEGTLLGELTVRGITLELERDALEIESMTLVWDAAAALRGAVVFEQVLASAVLYRRLPSDGTDAPRAAAIDLPVPIAVRRGRLQSLVIEDARDSLAFGRTDFAARFAGGRLELEDVATRTNGFELAGSGAVRLAVPVNLEADIAWSGPIEEQQWAGRATLRGDWPVLEIRQDLAAPFRAVAEGRLYLTERPRADLTIEWQDLAVPGMVELASPSGRLEIAGAVDAYEFAGAGRLEILDEPLEFSVRGTGAAALLSFGSLVLDGPHGGASLAGEVALDAQTFDLSVTARDLDPSVRFAEWPGRLTVSGRLRGQVEPELAWRLDGIELGGELRGHPIGATGALGFGAADGWSLEAVRAESGANLVELDGRIDEQLALAVSANLTDLDLLRPGLAGSLVADLTVRGPLRSPDLSGSVAASALELGDYSADRLSVSGDAHIGPNGALQLDVDARGVARGRASADVLEAQIAGTVEQHEIALRAERADWRMASSARGGFAGLSWQGSLDRLSVAQAVLGEWRLASPAALRVSRGSAAIDSACLEQSGAAGRVCAEARFEQTPEDGLRITARDFDLQTLQPLLPEGFSVQGRYDLSASLSDLSGAPRGSLAVQGGPTHVQAALSERDFFETELDRFVLEAELADWRLDAAAEISGRAASRVDLRAQMQDIRRPDSAIQGALNVFWPDLAFASLLSPDIGEVGGTLSVDLGVRGTADAPELEGRAQWDEGRVSVPAWGLVVEEIEADASSADGRRLEFLATGGVGDGELRLSGSAELDPGAGWPTELTLTGDSIEAVQLPNAEIFVSPDLAIVARLPNVNVTGTVHIPRARIELNALPEQAVAPSADTVLHGVEEVREVRPLQMHADIALTLGEDVDYSGLNLTADVSGQLRLIRDSGRSTTASGSLRLAGSYNAYGQTLQLDRGRLLFTGPLDDPALDVRAVRTIEGRTVGVELTGTVKSPQTGIYSNPSMSEADALAYLLFGRPVTGTGSDETATLQTAAVSMGLQQALPVVARIGQSLGFDEFTVQTTEDDPGALTAGKYLSPKVYIRYSYGLFNKIGGLLLRFRVNERLSIETRSGDQKSMDLLYTVEKD